MKTAMNCDRAEELLPDWMEGTLGEERAELEAHFAGCTSCRTLADDLQRIVTAAAALPVLPPARELWPGIAARLTPNGSVTSLADRRSAGTAADRLAPPLASRRFTRWRAPLAAAAAVLVVATATLWATREPATAPLATVDSVVTSPMVATTPDDADREASAPVADVRPEAAVAGSTSQPSRPQPRPRGVALASSTPYGGGDLLAETYAREIGLLSTMLETQREVLDTSTVAVLERNLAIIDAAIQESRRALEQDPASELLTNQLNTAFELKLDMLRRAVVLTSGA